MSWIDELKLPTNPDYDWELDPTQQPSYVNPVVLNNRVIQLANALLRVAQSVAAGQVRLRKAKDALVEAEAALEDEELDLLAQSPPPTSATSNKRLALHIRQAAVTLQREDTHRQLRELVRAAQADVRRVDAELDALRALSTAIKSMGEHIQTHLAYVKADMKHSGYA